MTAPAGASWEAVAHILDREQVSDIELAGRLDCPPGFVARVRSDLRMPSFPIPEPATRLARPVVESDRERFEAQSVVTGDGHRAWLGRHTEDGVPLFSSGVTAARVAFRLQHDEEPTGNVKAECVVEHCVEPLHQSDRLMRERAREVS